MVQSLKHLIKKYASHLIYRKHLKRQTFLYLLDRIKGVDGLPLSGASSDIFTYHGEDGIIQFLLTHLGSVPLLFVDIGSGDCVKSNCATLAIHQNWNGIFIDADEKQLALGRRFYGRLKKSNLSFVSSYVDPGNINSLILNAGYNGKIGLLSIDIDGNDYWIWDSLEIIRPAIVVIEAKVEFGMKSIVVPYSNENHHRFDKMYNGASVAALHKLGVRKGYTLVGANAHGYNLFFIDNIYLKPPFQAAETATLLQHPETIKSLYPASFFESHTFVLI